MRIEHTTPTIEELTEDFTVLTNGIVPMPVSVVSINSLTERLTKRGIPFDPKHCTQYDENKIVEYQLDMTHPNDNYIISVLISPIEGGKQFMKSGIYCSVVYFGLPEFVPAMKTAAETVRESYEAALGTGEIDNKKEQGKK